MRYVLLTLTLALVVTPTAAAGNPYKFSDRTKFERSMAREFVALERKKKRLIYDVLSIGCAKAGVGRAVCGLAARGPNGRQRFALVVDCKNDRGDNCYLTATPVLGKGGRP